MLIKISAEATQFSEILIFVKWRRTIFETF